MRFINVRFLWALWKIYTVIVWEIIEFYETNSFFVLQIQNLYIDVV